MENNIRIADLQIGQVVQGFYLMKDIRIRVSSAGSPYLSARISDITGVMDAKVWNYSGPISESDNGKAVLLQGEVTEFNRAHQMKIERIRLATEKDNYNLEDLIPVAPIDRQDALSEVFEIIGSIGDEDYRVLCQTMLNRHLSVFQSLPAAKSIHHAFLSGLHLLKWKWLVQFIFISRREDEKRASVCPAGGPIFGYIIHQKIISLSVAVKKVRSPNRDYAPKNAELRLLLHKLRCLRRCEVEMRFYRSKNPPSQTAYKVCVASVFYHTAKNKAIMTEKKTDSLSPADSKR